MNMLRWHLGPLFCGAGCTNCPQKWSYIYAWCRVPSWDKQAVVRGETLRKIVPCSQLLSLPLFPSAFFSSLEIITPNGSDVGHLLWLCPFFTLLQFILPVSIWRKRAAVCLEGGRRDGSICSLSGKVLSGTLHIQEMKGQRAARCVYVSHVDSTCLCQHLLPWLKQYEAFEF